MKYSFEIDPNLIIQGAKNLDDETRYVYGIYKSNLKDLANKDFWGLDGAALKIKHKNNDSLFYYPAQNPFTLIKKQKRNARIYGGI